MTVREYLSPQSLSAAIGLLELHGPELLVMAGGTVAMPLINEGISLPERVMSLRRVGLDTMEQVDGVLRIGAAATLTAIAEQDVVPLLAEAARATASWAVRNLATVGGNLFTPPPGGDVAVALLALDAVVRIAGPRGERSMPLGEFYTGFMSTALASDELVVGLDVPMDGVFADRSAAFVKFGRKHATTPSVVTVAVALGREPAGRVTSARVALGAVGPHPIRSHGAEAALAGSSLDADAVERAGRAAAGDARPFTDAVASEWYRRRMIPVVVGRALDRLAGRQLDRLPARPESRSTGGEEASR